MFQGLTRTRFQGEPGGWTYRPSALTGVLAGAVSAEKGLGGALETDSAMLSESDAVFSLAEDASEDPEEAACPEEGKLPQLVSARKAAAQSTTVVRRQYGLLPGLFLFIDAPYIFRKKQTKIHSKYFRKYNINIQILSRTVRSKAKAPRDRVLNI